jgi:YHS domain-containing protein
MRILILILLAYLGYRIVKTLVGSSSSGRAPQQGKTQGAIDDVMVKDPLCETYFPKRDGVKAVIKGETIYFCSEKCRDQYLARNDEAS